jgi:ubiquinol-cytochrome c reductase iron-sulfur subunit
LTIKQTMTEPANRKRRQLILATGTGASLAGAAGLWHSLKGKDYPHGAALSLDLSQLPSDKLLTMDWQNKAVWILRRTQAEVAALSQHDALLTDPQSDQSHQPSACRNTQRSLRADIFVAVGVCTHLGCTPGLQPGIGFLCPCHASRYDLAGRVFHQGPAPANLTIPAYHFASETQLVIGADA